MAKVKNYIVYEYLKSINDFKFIKQSIYPLELENFLKMDKSKVKDYLTKDLDKIKKVYKDKYIIFVEEIEAP